MIYKLKGITSKKIITSSLFISCILLSLSNLNAQSFTKGTIAINAGIGIGSSISYYSGSGTSRSPVIAANVEYGIEKVGPGVLGLGIAIGYQTASYTYNYNYANYFYKDRWTTTLFGIRGTYHPDFLQSDKYDVYGVVQLSFNHFGYTFESNDPYYNSGLYNYNHSISSYVRPSFLIGGRYYFTKAIGAFAEVGYDIAYLKLGIAFKFGGETASSKK